MLLAYEILTTPLCALSTTIDAPRADIQEHCPAAYGLAISDDESVLSEAGSACESTNESDDTDYLTWLRTGDITKIATVDDDEDESASIKSNPTSDSDEDVHDTSISSGGSSDQVNGDGDRGSGAVSPASSVEGPEQDKSEGAEFFEYIGYYGADCADAIDQPPLLEPSGDENQITADVDDDYLSDEDLLTSDANAVEDMTDETDSNAEQAATDPGDVKADLATTTTHAAGNTQAEPTSPPTTAILPPLALPAWSDDGEEGDMWEEAFEELTAGDNHGQGNNTTAVTGRVPEPATSVSLPDNVESDVVAEGYEEQMCSALDQANRASFPEKLYPVNTRGSLVVKSPDCSIPKPTTAARAIDVGIKPAPQTPLVVRSPDRSISGLTAGTRATDLDGNRAAQSPIQELTEAMLTPILEEDEHDEATPTEQGGIQHNYNPYVPPVYTKHPYLSTAGQDRLAYVKSYLSLPSTLTPVQVILYLSHPCRQTAPLQAALTNPAFLRACLELHFDELLRELPRPTNQSHAQVQVEQLQLQPDDYNRQAISQFIATGGVLAGTTCLNGWREPVREWEGYLGKSWEELKDSVEAWVAERDGKENGRKMRDERTWGWWREDLDETEGCTGFTRWNYKRPGGSRLREVTGEVGED